MPVAVKHATCGPRGTLKVTSMSMSCNNYGIIRLTNRKTYISWRSEIHFGTQKHGTCGAKGTIQATSLPVLCQKCGIVIILILLRIQCQCDSQAVDYILLWVARGKCAAILCNRIRGDRSRGERLMTLPYLTLPYLTLPYLTLPYLTSNLTNYI